MVTAPSLQGRAGGESGSSRGASPFPYGSVVSSSGSGVQSAVVLPSFSAFWAAACAARLMVRSNSALRRRFRRPSPFWKLTLRSLMFEGVNSSLVLAPVQEMLGVKVPR